MTHSQTTSSGSERLSEQANYLPIFLILIPLIEILLFAIAGYHLGFANGGWMGIAKLAILTIGAFLVAYATYRMAIEKGALLYVKGAIFALVLSGGSVGIVGSTFFIATSAGLSMAPVQEAELGAFLQEVGPYVDGRIAVVDQAAELAPIMQALAEDLSARTTQEGETGPGPIYRTLNSLFGRADGLSQQITVSLAVRQDVLAQITALRSAMEATLADEDRTIWDRRAEMRRQYTQLLSALTQLDQAIPVSLVRSYAAELWGGVLIPNREAASARINRTLGGYAASLTEALAAQKGVAGDPPAFPAKIGALETFRYAGKNIPIILAAFLVDLLFPLALWGYAVMTLVQIDKDRNPHRWAKTQRAESDIDVITKRRPMQIPRARDDEESSKPSSSTRNPGRPSGKSRR